jgi:hypothetical protein
MHMSNTKDEHTAIERRAKLKEILKGKKHKFKKKYLHFGTRSHRDGVSISMQNSCHQRNSNKKRRNDQATGKHNFSKYP